MERSYGHRGEAMSSVASHDAVPDWPLCIHNVDGCIGIRAGANRECLYHLTPRNLTRALDGVRRGGPLDARGTLIDEQLLRHILAAAPRSAEGHPQLRTALFDQAHFPGDASFLGVEFVGDASFNGISVQGWLILDQASFNRSLLVQGEASGLSCRRTRFSSGVTLRVGRAKVVLQQTVFGEPSILSSLPQSFLWSGRQQLRAKGGVHTSDLGPSLPKLMSVAQTDVKNLVVSTVDLRACRFREAYNLDQIRIEGPSIFPRTPKRDTFWSLAWRWTNRITLVEEHLWRIEHHGASPGVSWWPFPSGAGWDLEGVDDSSLDWHTDADYHSSAPNAEQIANIYRALRKGLEASKDEPGAADFYYGEMEMRRFAYRTPLAERFILYLYWLTSGYGLRGLRALAFLLLASAAATLLLQQVGFQDQGSFEVAALYIAGAITRLSYVPTIALNGLGNSIRIAMSLLGPLLIGLAILSIRNRVKR
jgi:hypothetical protein